MKALSIGAVARQAKVGIETIRYYERQGLLPQPSRRRSGYREYDQQAVRRLRFIRRAKELGFTLKEIKSLFALQVDANATRADVRKQAEQKIAVIEEKIRDLEQMRQSLSRLVNTCHGDGIASECPILEALDRSEDADSKKDSSDEP